MKKIVVKEGHSVLVAPAGGSIPRMFGPGSVMDGLLTADYVRDNGHAVEYREVDDSPPVMSDQKPASGVKGSPEEKWNLDPKGLKNKSLAQLNVMVSERDKDEQPFATREEAIAHLSQNFSG